MKCNKCTASVVSYGSLKNVFVHEDGCPNTNNVWSEEDQEWQPPIPDWDDDDWEDDEDEYQDEDRGGTGHGDMSYSDADPGL